MSTYSYKGDYGRDVLCYSLSQCVPMRPLTLKTRTEAQKAATKQLVHNNRLHCESNQAAILARTLIDNACVVLDTETTSLTGAVIQIALICSATKECLYQSYVHSEQPFDDESIAIHGITPEMIADAPSFSEVAQDIAEIMGKDRYWTAYNRKFDEDALLTSIIDKERERYDWISRKARCVMYDVAVPICGATNRHGTISLANAMAYFDISFQGATHNAEVDAMGTVELLHKCADLAIRD
ncbi:3'-5' exonuclease [Vibrio aestuarianus subsp. cardii]|uniref:3'-5' exonuclease n=1 Tax=Vibrio aestuarianus TaxID=28171 RepID=UPI0015C52E77|nr:3'-5' exonuclease [Vibrio aestuarianus]NGZ66597.1 3'-5' exonuclease [Vibrio aestuarianus subsp. cardii]